jgi:hypothetical protein
LARHSTFLCPASQDDEDSVADFLGKAGIADLSQGDGVNEIDVP